VPQDRQKAAATEIYHGARSPIPVRAGRGFLWRFPGTILRCRAEKRTGRSACAPKGDRLRLRYSWLTVVL